MRHPRVPQWLEIHGRLLQRNVAPHEKQRALEVIEMNGLEITPSTIKAIVQLHRCYQDPNQFAFL
jgi:hypothetical protein